MGAAEPAVTERHYVANLRKITRLSRGIVRVTPRLLDGTRKPRQRESWAQEIPCLTYPS